MSAESNWYYTDKKKERIGPVGKSVITQGIEQGEITKKSYVWNGASVPNWVHIEGVEEFQSFFPKEKSKAGSDDPFADLLKKNGDQKQKQKKQSSSDDWAFNSSEDGFESRAKSSDFGPFDAITQPATQTTNAFGAAKQSVAPPTKGVVNLGDGEQLIQIVNRLRDQGAHMEIDLPVICLCGQQSCGKSSVSESISGVPLPRASGTCTRCPTEVRMVEQNCDWVATVAVRFEWDDVKNRPLREMVEKVIGKTTIVSEVEALVSKAQNAILRNGRLKFSRNLVVVSIRGRECKNLTIVDLPGLIFATENARDQRYIQLVQNLVEDQIKKPNTLIAACVSAKDDMENQIINTLVRKYDPNGQRTIGIITKIDTIEEGLEEKWLEIVENRRYGLKLGYCLVKNPNQKELNLQKSYKEYRTMENQFFEKHSVWSNLSWDIKERIGTANLTRHMSTTLSALIKIQLPKIKTTTSQRIDNIRDQLLTLPQKPLLQGTPKDTIMVHVLGFVDEIKEFVRSPGGEFWTESMKVFQNFFRQLEECKPRFHKTDSKVQPNKLGVPSFNIQQVIKVSKEEASRALHFSASPRARKYFIKVSMKPWKNLSTATISSAGSVLNRVLLKLLKQHFGQYPRLMMLVKRNLDVLIQTKVQAAHFESTRFQFRETFEFTLSKANLRHVYQQAFQQLSKLFDEEINDTLKILESSGESYLVEEAIMVMAESLAYYDQSYRRYGDVVAMAMEHSMFREFSDEVHNHLFAELKLLTNPEEEFFKNLLTVHENPLVRRRIELEAVLERLETIMDELQAVPVNYEYISATDEMNQLDKMFANLNDEPKQDEKEESDAEEQDPSDESLKFSVATPKVVEEIKENAEKKKKRGWFG